MFFCLTMMKTWCFSYWFINTILYNTPISLKAQTEDLWDQKKLRSCLVWVPTETWSTKRGTIRFQRWYQWYHAKKRPPVRWFSGFIVITIMQDIYIFRLFTYTYIYLFKPDWTNNLQLGGTIHCRWCGRWRLWQPGPTVPLELYFFVEEDGPNCFFFLLFCLSVYLWHVHDWPFFLTHSSSHTAFFFTFGVAVLGFHELVVLRWTQIQTLRPFVAGDQRWVNSPSRFNSLKSTIRLSNIAMV